MLVVMFLMCALLGCKILVNNLNYPLYRNESFQRTTTQATDEELEFTTQKSGNTSSRIHLYA